MESTHENKMGTAPMLRLIVSMSLPAMFSMLIQALYNIVDSIFVSNISAGDAELTAVSIAFPIQLLMISVGVGTGIGINSLISRRLGEKNQAAADSAATHGMLLAALNWIVFAVLGAALSSTFCGLFTRSGSIREMATAYLAIATVGSLGLFVQLHVEKTLQATGNMIYPMISQLIGAITNIILDPIFIFTFRLGVAGAAIATVIGQFASMVFVLIVAFTKDHAVRITFRGFRWSWTSIRNIYAVGIPSIIMQSIGSFLIMGLNAILKGFSDTATAVLGVYYKLQSFVFMPVFGLTQGVMPIFGYNFGARNYKRTIRALRIGNLISVIIMVIGTVLFWVFPDQLLRIFNASDEMLTIGREALRIISLSFPLAAFGIQYSTLFQAIGMGGKSLFISVLRQMVIILPAAYLLSRISLLYLWYAFPIAELVSLVVSIWMYRDVCKKYLKD